MADQQETEENNELEGISEEDAKRLLEKPKSEGQPSDDDDDPEGADKLDDPGRKALEHIKEQRRAVREERDRIKAELEKAQQELRKHSDKDKSETQRLQEERDQLKAELGKATSAIRRREFAEEFAPEHATPAQIRAVAKRLSGDTDAELEADAKELYALIAPASAKAPVSKPKERLRGGGDPDDGPDESDPRKLAALIPRAR